MAYDDRGNPREVMAWDGVSGEPLAKSESTYDLLNRPTETRRHVWRGGEDPAGASVLTYGRTFDPAGNVISRVGPRGFAHVMTYDNAERLAEVLDPVGNRTELVRDPAGNVTATRSHEVSDTGAAVARESTSAYDALSRQVRYEDPLANAWQRIYDARGNTRYAIDPENAVTEWAYDGLSRPVRHVRPKGGSEAPRAGYDVRRKDRRTARKARMDERTRAVFNR